ncbi:MAG TPA: DUF3806 domain-containing protein [Verrucomicrobiae bacterium]|jgi:hypothetical protein|nr:DUF3806 domain-containing protein [Verrucomicrobiae bacterium]
MKKTLLFVLVTMLFVDLSIAQNPKNMSQTSSPKFAELSKEDAARLEKQRHLIAVIAMQKYGAPALTKTKSDLPILQRILDDKVFKKSQTYELQCLGITFGDVLASEFPLRWVMVTDEYGTDPTLRFKETTWQINALTMISKRVEKGEIVNLAELVRLTGEYVKKYQ